MHCKKYHTAGYHGCHLSLNWRPLDDIICLRLKILLYWIPLDLISFVLDNMRISLTFRQSKAFSQLRQLHSAASEEGFVVATGDLKLNLFFKLPFLSAVCRVMFVMMLLFWLKSPTPRTTQGTTICSQFRRITTSLKEDSNSLAKEGKINVNQNERGVDRIKIFDLVLGFDCQCLPQQI